jgi:Acetyltransferase (GNAT) domain
MKIRAVDSPTTHCSGSLVFKSVLQGEPETERLVLRTIHNLDELETLRTIWQCWPGTRESDLDFFSSVVRSRSGCRPYITVLFRDAKPDAILVGLRERRKLSYRFGWFTICELEIDVLEFVVGGLRGIASEANCAAFVRDVLRSLDEGNADMVFWKELDMKSPLRSYALQWPRFAQRDHFPCVDGHWWIKNLPESLNSFFMSRKTRQRSKLRQKYRNVLKHFAGTIRIRCFRSVADLEVAIRDMEEIASKASRRLFGLGFLDTPESREHMLRMAQMGWLRIYILYLAEKPAAFWKGSLYQGCLQGEHVGYDPVWSKFSPGIFLFLNMIEDFRKEAVTKVDLGFGDTQLKQYLGNCRCLESQVRIYAPTLRGLLLNLLNLICPRINDSARFLLQRTGCLEWAKRARRNRLMLEDAAGIVSAGGQRAPRAIGSDVISNALHNDNC